jgi:hypothetical protein
MQQLKSSRVVLLIAKVWLVTWRVLNPVLGFFLFGSAAAAFARASSSRTNVIRFRSSTSPRPEDSISGKSNENGENPENFMCATESRVCLFDIRYSNVEYTFLPSPSLHAD